MRLIYKIKQLFFCNIYKVKWFYQRGKRGYADCDCWSMDSYLCSIIIPMLRQFGEGGYPGYGAASTSEKWKKLLGEMVEGFEAARRVIDRDYPDGSEWLESTNADIKLFQKKSKLFIRWFFHLWD